MPLLHIALQEGFSADAVRVSVNGRELFHKDGVRTRTQIGLADSFEVTLPSGEARIEVTARGATHAIGLSLSDDRYVGVSITPEGDIVHKESATAFGYV